MYVHDNSGADNIIQAASQGAISTIRYLSTANQKSVMQLLLNAELTPNLRKDVWHIYLGEREIHQQVAGSSSNIKSFRWLDHVSKYDVIITQTAERLVKQSSLGTDFTTTKVMEMMISCWGHLNVAEFLFFLTTTFLLTQ